MMMRVKLSSSLQMRPSYVCYFLPLKPAFVPRELVLFEFTETEVVNSNSLLKTDIEWPLNATLAVTYTLRED